jgi:hypothetical protein
LPWGLFFGRRDTYTEKDIFGGNMKTTLELSRPQADTGGNLKYAEVLPYLEAKYALKKGEEPGAHYKAWCKKKGYLKLGKDPEGKSFRLSTIWYDEYCADPQGLAECPKPQSLWVWLQRLVGRETSQSREPIGLNLEFILDRYDEDLAPLLQKLRDAQQLRINEEIEATVPAELRPRALLQCQLEPAAMPGYVRTILEHMKTEFGPRIKLVAG